MFVQPPDNIASDTFPTGSRRRDAEFCVSWAAKNKINWGLGLRRKIGDSDMVMFSYSGVANNTYTDKDSFTITYSRGF